MAELQDFELVAGALGERLRREYTEASEPVPDAMRAALGRLDAPRDDTRGEVPHGTASASSGPRR